MSLWGRQELLSKPGIFCNAETVSGSWKGDEAVFVNVSIYNGYPGHQCLQKHMLSEAQLNS